MFERSGTAGELPYNGTFALLGLNVLLFAADHLLHLPLMRSLYLQLDHPAWYQYVTSLFCHANWAHLSGNLFFLYLFGRLVEEREGASGVILSYLACGAGSNAISVLFMSGGVLLGASGAVFGLFTVSVLTRISWHWRHLLEVVVLGQFVIVQTISEARNIRAMDGIGHLAHVGGAVTGALLIFAMAQLLRKGEGMGSRS
jgi:membrane associated rhomboid family serine protease